MSESARTEIVPGSRCVLVDQQPGVVEVYGWKNVDLVFWQATSSLAGTERMQRLIMRRAEESANKVSSVHMLTRGVSMPDGNVRDALTEL